TRCLHGVASVSHFFFQAEDGIRDRNVTGVQTCALPILDYARGALLKYVDLSVIRTGGIFYEIKNRLFLKRKRRRKLTRYHSYSYKMYALITDTDLNKSYILLL